ncbi:unnamed protein product [Arabidopsis halleri]
MYVGMRERMSMVDKSRTEAVVGEREALIRHKREEVEE